MVTIRKDIFTFLVSSFRKLYGLTTRKGFIDPQTEPCLTDRNFMRYFSHSTEDQVDKFPQALKFRTLPECSLRSIC